MYTVTILFSLLHYLHFQINLCLSLISASECNPKEFIRKENPESQASFFYCNTDGTLAKRDCPSGKIFKKEKGDCDFPDQTYTKPPKIPVKADEPNLVKAVEPLFDAPIKEKLTKAELDPFLEPQFQAPDDICSGGIPLTKLGAPVACNPQVSSCPDGYACILYSRTGTSYCCQHTIEPAVQDNILCSGNQVTFFEVRITLFV